MSIGGIGGVANEGFMDAARAEAAKGLRDMTRGALLLGVRIYRFASSRNRERFFTGPWWFGQSPFDSMKGLARQSGRPLPEAARECLAVDFDWNDMDFLVSATVASRLAAWIGTPLTQSIKSPTLVLPRGDRQGGHYIRRWEPDRSITQYYIPGLYEPMSKDWVTGKTPVLRPGWRPASQHEQQATQPLWQIALTARQEQPLAIVRL